MPAVETERLEGEERLRSVEAVEMYANDKTAFFQAVEVGNTCQAQRRISFNRGQGALDLGWGLHEAHSCPSCRSYIHITACSFIRSYIHVTACSFMTHSHVIRHDFPDTVAVSPRRRQRESSQPLLPWEGS